MLNRMKGPVRNPLPSPVPLLVPPWSRNSVPFKASGVVCEDTTQVAEIDAAADASKLLILTMPELSKLSAAVAIVALPPLSPTVPSPLVSLDTSQNPPLTSVVSPVARSPLVKSSYNTIEALAEVARHAAIPSKHSVFFILSSLLYTHGPSASFYINKL